jgi:alanyl-tRNA synthetase
MLSKESLKSEFARDFKKHYEVELFRKEGFSHSVCPKCGKGYWSAGLPTCGDSSHEKYSFFRKTPRTETYAGFWKKFADFWAKRGHTVLPRYPVLSRWRDDLFFTIASIVDFQRLEQGKIVFEYPANPLVVPQMCLRFPDIANIGVTGRHFSCFMMAGQHAFNPPKEGYWKDECLQYNYEFLTQVLGINKNEVAYGEDVWNMPDFSAFGPCIEAFSKGSELVNSVFMQFRANNSGYEELPIKVIDVGWGFERLLWFYNGNLTAYDSVFPREVEFMKQKTSLEINEDLFARYAELSAGLNVEEVLNVSQEREKIAKLLGVTKEELHKSILPMQGIYAVADHSRTLLFALSDGALPSNTAGGYNLRVVLRRALSFMDEYDAGFDLLDVMRMHAEDLKPLFPELSENFEDMREIIEVEKKKFGESKAKTNRIAGELVKKGKPPSVDELVTLYESNGITPELLEKSAERAGMKIEIPSEFYRRATDRHVMEEKKEAPKEAGGISLDGLPQTVPTYYENDSLASLDAKILALDKTCKVVVLDKTIFYPEGGGQCADHGTINGAEVYEVQKKAGIILHYLKTPLAARVGDSAKLVLNAERRSSITRHHSSAHVLIATTRKVLGNHVWQCGSKKDEDEAHVDITHFEKPTRAQQDEIEKLANLAVMEAHPITVTEMDRGVAEQKYSYRLYQGGGAIGKRIRVLEVQGIDVESCGGLHRHNTSEIGLIKITGFEQIQDGVMRVHYKSGPQALEFVQKQETLLDEGRAVFSVGRDDLPKTASRFFDEWKERGKEVEKMRLELAQNMGSQLVAAAKASPQKLVEKFGIDADARTLELLANEVAQQDGLSALLSNKDGFLVAACNPKSGKSAQDLIKTKGLGGGTQAFARGKLK